MLYILSHKRFEMKKFIFILLILLKFCHNDECKLTSFLDLNYVKALTLENGYQLMVTKTGIFSFYPGLASFAYNYNFTGDQILDDGVDSMENTINQVEISQFIKEEEGKRYILCLAKNYIYFMNEKGEIFINEKLSDFGKNTISLTAYKYFNDSYYFIIAYNMDFFDNNEYTIRMNYYNIYKENGQYVIKLLKSPSSYTPYIEEFNGYKCVIPSGISCQAMISSINGKVFACFESLKYINRFSAFVFNPDDDFNLLFKETSLPIKDKNNENANATYIKSALNDDKSQAFICYSIESISSLIKCVSYDINNNRFTELSFDCDFCNTKYFGFNINYFPQTREYVVSCITQNKKKFYCYQLNQDYQIIRNDDRTFVDTTFDGCDQWNSFFDSYSVIYVSKTKQYTLIINSACYGFFDANVRLYILNKNKDSCIMPTLETTIITTLPETTIITTLPETTIISTLTETTIITTLPETTIITTLPETTIITTLPETTIITTLPIKESIIPILETTEPKIKTTFIEKESTIIDIIDIKTTIPNIETTIIEMSSSFSTIPINYIEEYLCEENKIYFEGKCICDKDNGYVSINDGSFSNGCYKNESLPENVYFNNITQSYEFCYKTCGTCIKGGDFSENNCKTCALDYIKEPENKTTNCVENCNYLYYYDMANQYSCTDDAQCPEEVSLLVRNINKCTNKCSNENRFQYNGECLSSCPEGTTLKSNSFCQLTNTAVCSMGEYKLNLNETIAQENVQLASKNYASEFYYTENHISTFKSSNFTMALYKNSSCIDELKLNITKIDYDSCIQQLKVDNNIDENKDLIIAVVDIINKKGNNMVTSFGFFNPETGEKLDATKSCTDKNVVMYEDILSLLDDPLTLQLLEEQKIDIFDKDGDFYNDICFHFNSPNGKDATLQDRMKSFYPNITLCDDGCKIKGTNLTTMRAECECAFQDLLSKNIYENDLLGDNVIIKESIQEITDIIQNLNLEILACYRDVFSYKYFKKNRCGFIIIVLFILYTICIIFYYTISKNKTLKYIYSLAENYILLLSKEKSKKTNKKRALTHCPVKKKKNNKVYNINNNNKKHNLKREDISKDKNKIKIIKVANQIDKDKEKNTNSLFIKNKNRRNILKEKIINNLNDKNKVKSKNIIKDLNKNKENIKETKIYNLKNRDKNKNGRKIDFKQINIINLNLKSLKNSKNIKDYALNKSKSSTRLLKNNSNTILNKERASKKLTFKPKFSGIKNKKKIFKKKIINNENIELNKFLESSIDDMDYDEVVEGDKRTFWEYFCEKIKTKQIIINSFFIEEIIKQKSIKIAVFIGLIDIYLLTNGLFFSDSYISEIFNSTEKETFLTFIKRSIERFFYITIVANIIAYVINIFFVDENKIKKIFLKNKDDSLTLRYEICELLKIIFKYIKILVIINFILIIFSWYYLSCFNNVYPNLNNEWLYSSILLIAIFQILPFIFALTETSIRFASIRYDSEKLFKLSLLL